MTLIHVMILNVAVQKHSSTDLEDYSENQVSIPRVNLKFASGYRNVRTSATNLHLKRCVEEKQENVC